MRKEMQEYMDEVDAEGIEVVVVGTGQYGKLGLLDEARDLLEEKEIEEVELKTPEAIENFESRKESRGKKLGIFHVTC